MDAKGNGSTLQDFFRLPIFCLTGGSEEARHGIGERLMVQLAERSLLGVYLRRGETCTPYTLTCLARQYDVVIVSGALQSPEQKICLGPYEGGRDRGASWSLGCEEGGPGFVEGLLEKLTECERCTPVWGCILIGGKSSRMGRPKHLLTDGRGKTWLENTLATLQPLLAGVVVSGKGFLPETLGATTRLPDIPGVMGPMAGILAAGRWQPLVSWLVVACDMPHVSPEAVNWLLAGRRPGCWGRVPKFFGNDRLEPLLAWYDFRSIHLFEEQLLSESRRISEVAGNLRIDHPIIPGALSYAWENVNTPEQLRAARG